jgi:transposase
MEFTHYVGIDVSKDTLDFAVNANGKIIANHHCQNTKKGISQVVKQLRQLPDFKMTQAVFCMEYTGIYNNPVLDFLWSCKSSIWMEPALRIKQSQGMTRGKNDTIDAERIAEYAYTYREKIRLWKPSSEAIKQLKGLIAFRDRLVNSIKQLSVPANENALFISKDLLKTEKKITRRTITALKKSLAEVEKEMEQLIKNNAEIKEMVGLMTSVPGVGPIVAVNMIVATDEFKKFDDADKFACYCGVVPFDHRSGSSLKGRSRVSHLAHKKMKALLHLAAMAAITSKGELRDYYQRKIEEGKNRMSILNAIRNKIIHRIFTVVKRKTEYQKKYSNSLV